MATMLLHDGEFVLESVISKLFYEPQCNFHIRGYMLELMCMMFVAEETSLFEYIGTNDVICNTQLQF